MLHLGSNAAMNMNADSLSLASGTLPFILALWVLTLQLLTPWFLFSKENSSVFMKSHIDPPPVTARGLQRIMFEKKNNGAMGTRTFVWVGLFILYPSGLKRMMT